MPCEREGCRASQRVPKAVEVVAGWCRAVLLVRFGLHSDCVVFWQSWGVSQIWSILKVL